MSKEFYDLVARHDHHAGKIKSEREKLQKVDQRIAEINCPFKVGDRVVNKNGVLAEVCKISRGWNVKDYKMFVFKVKKKGGLYSDSNEASEWAEWTLDGKQTND